MSGFQPFAGPLLFPNTTHWAKLTRLAGASRTLREQQLTIDH